MSDPSFASSKQNTHPATRRLCLLVLVDSMVQGRDWGEQVELARPRSWRLHDREVAWLCALRR